MNRKINIKCKNDYRSFKRGYEIDLDYTDTNLISLMGKNGCGKSTIIQAIRGNINSNEDANSKWHSKDVCEEIKDNFDVSIEGFEKVYHLDPDGLDNTNSMFNAASATDFIELGGWATRFLSSGEKTLALLAKLKNNVVDAEDTLIILDEVDNHLDYDLRINFNKWMNKLFPLSKKLIITHDILSVCLGDGDAVIILSSRVKKNNKNICEAFGRKAVHWKNEDKGAMFTTFTGRTITKEEPIATTNDNGEIVGVKIPNNKKKTD